MVFFQKIILRFVFSVICLDSEILFQKQFFEEPLQIVFLLKKGSL